MYDFLKVVVNEVQELCEDMFHYKHHILELSTLTPLPPPTYTLV